MGAGLEGLRHRRLGQDRADREAAAQALGAQQDIGFDLGPFVGIELACAAQAALHFIQDQQQAKLVADLAGRLEKRQIGGANSPFTLDRLIEDRCGIVSDRRPQFVEIAEGHVDVAWDMGREAFHVLFIARRRDGIERPAVEGPPAGDNPPAIRLADVVEVLAGQLHRRFKGFNAGVAEENLIGKGMRHQPFGQLLTLGDAEQIGAVPNLIRHLLQHRHQGRVRMAQRGHRDAAAKIQVASPILAINIGALALDESQICTRVVIHQRRAHSAKSLYHGRF